MEKEMSEIYHRLGKIETSLARIDERIEIAMAKNSDFEGRLRSLESWRAWMLGALAVMTPIWSLVVVWLTKKMGI